MNVLMMTNTYLPHVGGVSRSVSTLANGLLEAGHDVLIVAPDINGEETNHAVAETLRVIRVPAIKQLVGGGFSVPLRMPRSALEAINEFRPDIIHTHHPFLLGIKALRISKEYAVPTVFTFHTRYDLYGHYVSLGSDHLKRLIVSLGRGYCNLCHQIIAPSASIATHLREAGVDTPIEIVPTGIDVERFRQGRGVLGRERWKLRKEAFVIGYVGRIAAEKNIGYLADGFCRLLAETPDAVALIVGDGPLRTAMENTFKQAGVADRVCFTGFLFGTDLADAYASMDVFGFASYSETQGLVLVEAMAAGVPVVALEAPGTRETVRNGENGTLLGEAASAEEFCLELQRYRNISQARRSALECAARRTAANFSSARMVRRTAELYEQVRLERVFSRQQCRAWSTFYKRLACRTEITAAFVASVAKTILPRKERPRRVR